jgi:hypothetical protein
MQRFVGHYETALIFEGVPEYRFISQSFCTRIYHTVTDTRILCPRGDKTPLALCQYSRSVCFDRDYVLSRRDIITGYVLKVGFINAKLLDDGFGRRAQNKSSAHSSIYLFRIIAELPLLNFDIQHR